ncbi:MAG: hypothetical protein Q4G58_02500 [bacterium]|nr:hypothetical protein [bacterium]
MRITTFDRLSQAYSQPDKEEMSIKREYIVSGKIPKALGNSLVEQIRSSNNDIRTKAYYK